MTAAVGPLASRLLLAWAAGLVPLLFWLGTFDMFEMPKQLALKAAATGIALAAVAGGGTLRIRAAPAMAAAGFLSVSLLSSVLSPLPLFGFLGEYTSYQGWLHFAALATIAVSAAGPGDARRALVAGVLSSVLVSCYALIQLGGADPFAWKVESPVVRAFSTLGNPLFLGFLLAAAFPAALGLAAGARGAARAGLTAAAALLLAGLVASGSRSAFAGGIVGALLLLVSSRRGEGGGSRRFLLKAGAWLAGLALVLGVFLPPERNPFHLLFSRFSQVVRGEDARPWIWSGAARLVVQSPLTGHGPDTFASLSPKVQSPALWRYVWRGSPEKAHNELVQAAATTGVLGLGALLWFLAVLVRAGWRRRDDAHGAAAFSALAALAVPSMFGFLTCGPEALALPAVVLLLSGCPARPIPRGAAVAVAGVLCASLLVHAHLLAAETAMKQAARVGRGYERAVALYAPWPQRLMRAGDALERAAFGPTVAGRYRTDPAVMEVLGVLYGRAMAADPGNAYAINNAARLAARTGRKDEAIALYERARAAAPADAYVAMEEAQALAAFGRDGEAVRLLDATSALYPEFAEPLGLAGYIHLKRKDMKKAEAVLRKAVGLDWHGNDAAGYAAASNLVVIYRAWKRYPDEMWAATVGNDFAGRLRRP